MMLNSVWIVPLSPLLGALLNCFFGQRYSRAAVGYIAIASVGLSFCVAVAALVAFVSGPASPHTLPLFTWIASGDYSTRVGFLIDGLSLTMMLVIAGVGLLIHIYSTGYMHDEPDYARYFAYLNLFVGAMLILVMADNYLFMFVGWEGVGLSSYLLIGFWYTRQSAADAGKKAFIVNRIGDFGFLLAILLLFVTFQTADILQVQTQLEQAQINPGILTAIALLLFMGAVGKSAQLPLHVWLPDAMEGPTPVSALIHAATMVTAGVYMTARSAMLFTMAPAASGLVALVGIATALFAATMALVATDIKRVLAYSTVSQLGYMVFAVGLGAYAAGIFHLVTHAFFKALLFLGAGAVIHALAGEQDMRKMGNLRAALPATHWMMCVATLAIAGIFPFAGFWSKDEILASAWKAGGANYLWCLVGVVTAFLTAFYMFRLLYLTFYGQSRVASEVAAQVHEAPASMRTPLLLLALLCIGGGLLGWPPEHGLLHRLLAPVFEPAWHAADLHHAFGFVDVVLMLVSLGLAVGGWATAYHVYVREPQVADEWAERWRTYYTLLVNTYYVDAGYLKGIVRPIHAFAGVLWNGFDIGLIDRLVNGVAGCIRGLGTGLSFPQSGYVRTYAFWVVVGTMALLWSFLT
ncbi:NADH-quinone oxidoreductase subunit L [Candidatus Entotheonellaceae bacterium PAL068K]